MQRNTDHWLGDLRVAASFVRTIHTGRADLDFELQGLAQRIEHIAATMSEEAPLPTIEERGRDAA